MKYIKNFILILIFQGISLVYAQCDDKLWGYSYSTCSLECVYDSDVVNFMSYHEISGNCSMDYNECFEGGPPSGITEGYCQFVNAMNLSVSGQCMDAWANSNDKWFIIYSNNCDMDKENDLNLDELIPYLERLLSEQKQTELILALIEEVRLLKESVNNGNNGNDGSDIYTQLHEIRNFMVNGDPNIEDSEEQDERCPGIGQVWNDSTLSCECGTGWAPSYDQYGDIYGCHCSEAQGYEMYEGECIPQSRIPEDPEEIAQQLNENSEEVLEESGDSIFSRITEEADITNHFTFLNSAPPSTTCPLKDITVIIPMGGVNVPIKFPLTIGCQVLETIAKIVVVMANIFCVFIIARHFSTKQMFKPKTRGYGGLY